MQIIQSGPSKQTLRQAALDEAMNNMLGGIQGLERQSATKRQEALQLQKMTQDLRQQGYDVNEDMVKKSLEPEQSGISKMLAGTKVGDFFGIQKQERPDLYGKRTDEYLAAQKQAEDDKKFKRESELFDREYKLQQLGQGKAKNEFEVQKMKNELAAARQGEQMKAGDIAKFNEGNAIPAMLNDLGKTIDQNKDSFGPIAGRLNSINPWDEKSKTIESQIASAAQTVGKFMEGGVLRAEDVPKYRKMLPDTNDTPEVAANKLKVVQKLLIDKQNSDIEALRGAGYNVSSIDRGFKAPGMPDILSGGKTGQWGNDAAASDPAIIKKQLKTMSREEKIRLLQGGSPR